MMLQIHRSDTSSTDAVINRFATSVHCIQSFTSLVHFWPNPIYNSCYAYVLVAVSYTGDVGGTCRENWTPRSTNGVGTNFGVGVGEARPEGPRAGDRVLGEATASPILPRPAKGFLVL